MEGPYIFVENPKGRGYDVIRMEPSVVAAELKRGEAEALAFAMNTQNRILEGRLK